MRLAFSVGPLQFILRRKPTREPQAASAPEVRNQSGGFASIGDHPNHERLAAAAQRFAGVVSAEQEAARAKLAAAHVAQLAHGARLVTVLRETDAVDLCELLAKQAAAGHLPVGNLAIKLGRDVLVNDLLKSDLFLYVEVEPRRRETHFQDGNRVVLGVRPDHCHSFRQVGLGECENVDPEKLRAALTSLADQAAALGELPPGTWVY